ncbi:MAG TPA: hypothetical protein HA362_01590 [Nanoarchaeota archaeon]|nr:hypothetical protein [Nanoarchaeota archaeon]
MRKRGAIETSTLVAMILLLAFLIIVATVIFANDISSEDMKKFGCWASNGLKSSNIAFKKMLPTTCELINVEEPVDMPQLVSMMKDAWWMYGKGDWDFGIVKKEIPVYYFQVKEDIPFAKLIEYMVAHKDGDIAKGLEDSDYHSFQKGAEGQRLCTGRYVGNAEEGERAVLKKSTEDKPHFYFIMFWDDTSVIGMGKEEGDKMVLAGKPQLKDEGKYYCWSIFDMTHRSTIEPGATLFGISLESVGNLGWG